MGGGEGVRVRQIRVEGGMSRVAGGFLAVKGFFLFRRARVFFWLRHAGSIDQISGSDQDLFGGV